MMNLLLWRPKRLTVLGTKLAAVLTTLTGVTVVLGALWTLAFWLIGTYRGTTAKVTSGVWQSAGLTGLRALGLILAVGAVASRWPRWAGTPRWRSAWPSASGWSARSASGSPP